jgi:hypothetical protein
MESEIVICPTCKIEVDLIYIQEEVIAQTRCKCRTNDKDKLKKALHIIKKDILSGKHGAATKASFIKYWRSV